MDVIFGSAQAVHVWLGPEAQESSLAIRSLKAVPKDLHSMIEENPLLPLEALGLPSIDNPVWPAMGHLYHCRWNTRVWTFQELVLAREIKIFCPGESVDWESFRRVGGDLSRLVLLRYVLADEDEQEGFKDGSYLRLSIVVNSGLDLPEPLIQDVSVEKVDS